MIEPNPFEATDRHDDEISALSIEVTKIRKMVMMLMETTALLLSIHNGKESNRIPNPAGNGGLPDGVPQGWEQEAPSK